MSIKDLAVSILVRALLAAWVSRLFEMKKLAREENVRIPSGQKLRDGFVCAVLMVLAAVFFMTFQYWVTVR